MLNDLKDVDQLQKMVHRALQEESLLDFTHANNADYESNWFHEELCHKLEKFFMDIILKKSPRLMIFAPPRHGKSELASRQFTAWVLGKVNKLKMKFEIMQTSYSGDLAGKMGKDVKSIMDGENFKDVFPDAMIPDRGKMYDGNTYINKDNEFELVGGLQSVRLAGVGGSLTGMGAHLLTIDDPVKDQQEANSKTRRDAVWDWYTTVARTRVAPGGGVLVILTRWHKDDLAGRILKKAEEFKKQDFSHLTEEQRLEKYKEVDDFEVISYPAIATEDEEHRKEGGALHPERFPLSELVKTKNSMEPSRWSSLYQQNPYIAGGNMIKTGFWQWYDVDAMPNLKYKFITGDTALKDGEKNDYSVFQLWGKDLTLNRIYLIDMIRGKWIGEDLDINLVAFYNKHKGDLVDYHNVNIRDVFIEDKASGTNLIQRMQQQELMPVTPVSRTKDKYTRTQDAEPYVRQGYVYLPSHKPPFVANVLEESSAFPNAEHDDVWDATMDAIDTQFIQEYNIYSGA